MSWARAPLSPSSASPLCSVHRGPGCTHRPHHSASTSHSHRMRSLGREEAPSGLALGCMRLCHSSFCYNLHVDAVASCGGCDSSAKCHKLAPGFVDTCSESCMHRSCDELSRADDADYIHCNGCPSSWRCSSLLSGAFGQSGQASCASNPFVRGHMNASAGLKQLDVDDWHQCCRDTSHIANANTRTDEGCRQPPDAFFYFGADLDLHMIRAAAPWERRVVLVDSLANDQGYNLKVSQPQLRKLPMTRAR